MNPLAKLLKDSLTAMDGESYAVIKVLGGAIVLVYLGLSIASFVMIRAFDMMAFGTGAGLAVGAMAAAIKLTETSEPKEKEPPK